MNPSKALVPGLLLLLTGVASSAPVASIPSYATGIVLSMALAQLALGLLVVRWNRAEHAAVATTRTHHHNVLAQSRDEALGDGRAAALVG